MSKYIKLVMPLLFLLVLTSCNSLTSDVHNNTEQDNSSGNNDSSIGIIYFSATGNTEIVSLKLGTILNVTPIEIVPLVPYTNEDLNYNDNDCRANQEQNDPNARPEIENVINIEAYETIFLGYPIWWGKLPKIIYTFMESYSFDKKMIIPFCTSGSSGISYSENELHQLAPVADFKEGRRFSSSVDTNELYSWIESLNL